MRIFEVPAHADAAEPADAPISHAAPDDAWPPRRPRWPGAVAAGIAILMVVTWAVALVCSLAGMFELGIGLSISAILLSAPAVVVGLVAIVTNRGRGWGLVGLLVGVLLNPVVLLYGLGWIGAL